MLGLFLAISATPMARKEARQASSSISEEENSEDEINNINHWDWGWNRPTRPSSLVQPTAPRTTTTTVPLAPPSQAAIQRCMRTCLRTNEYNPMCTQIATGERKTYYNEGDFVCGRGCGEGTILSYTTFLYTKNTFFY